VPIFGVWTLDPIPAVDVATRVTNRGKRSVQHTVKAIALAFVASVSVAGMTGAARAEDQPKPSGGTVKGAAVGAAAGHVMGGHAKSGAAVGAVAGHHERVKSEESIKQTGRP